MNNLVKLAAGDQEFEQGFFQLAYDKIQSKLYNLVPFLVGFQLVKKNETGTKAVGVFGFKSNNGQILFVPAFFVNGKIKELDILYSRNNNQFYPLTEEFAELFLKDDVTGIGSPANEKKEQINKSITNPNMRDVIWPPRTGRITYAEAKDLEEKNLEAFDKVASLLEPKTYKDSPSLLTFVKQADNTVKEAFWDLLNKRADFVDAVTRFYTTAEIADSLKVEKVAKEVPEPKVQLYDLEDASIKLAKEDKQRVLTEGYTIIDKRAEEEVSKAGEFKFTESFTNPNKSGFYPYITETGSIRHGLIIINPANLLVGFNESTSIVIDLDSKKKGQAYEVDNNKVYIKDQIDIKDINLAKALEMLEDPNESTPSYSDYILINEELCATEPFSIIENYKDSSGIRRIKVQPKWFAETKVNRGEKNKSKEDGCDGTATLVLTKQTHGKIERRNKAIYVPKGYKLLKLEFSTSYYPCLDSSLPKAEYDQKKKEREEEQARIREGKPGTISSLLGALRENNTFPMTIHTNGSQYFLNVGGAKVKYENPLEAKIAMVAEVGLREKDAEAMLVNLIPNTKRKGYVKIAVTGDQTLSLVDEYPEMNEFGQPTYYGIPWVDQHDRSDGYTGDPTQMGLGVKPDMDQIDNTVNQAVQIAQNGQKDVFDTQAIAALSRYADTSTKVLEYVPNFVSSLDKLGRMLFLAYWDTDKFEKMYGKDELPELLELIRNVFTNLGDLIIFMKRKVPDLSINENEQSQTD